MFRSTRAGRMASGSRPRRSLLALSRRSIRRAVRRGSHRGRRYDVSGGEMKRTNLFIDQALLKQVMRALGVRTYSEAVNLSLTETLRVKRVQALPNFFGEGLWEGDLSKMRQDRPR